MSSKKVIFLNDVRLSYPDLWKPGKPMNEGDTPKYGSQFLFDADGPVKKLVEAAMVEMAKLEFGENWANIVRTMSPDKKCMRSGDDSLDKGGAVRDGYAGMKYVVARNAVQPLIIGPRRTKPAGTNALIEGVQYSDGFPVLTSAGGKPFGGCYVNGKVEITASKAWEKVPSQIYAKLLAVQYVRDGAAFGGSMPSAEGFGESEAEAGADDLGLGGDQDVSF